MGKKGVTKPSKSCMEGRLSIVHTVLPLGSIQLLFRKMPEPALTGPLLPRFQRSSLVGEDQRPDQGDGWNRAYSPYVSSGTEWEKLLNNEKISKGLFVVSVQLVAVLSDSSVKVWWRTHPAMTLCHNTLELLFRKSHRDRARVPWIEVSQRRGSTECTSFLTNKSFNFWLQPRCFFFPCIVQYSPMAPLSITSNKTQSIFGGNFLIATTSAHTRPAVISDETWKNRNGRRDAWPTKTALEIKGVFMTETEFPSQSSLPRRRSWRFVISF